MTNARDKKIRWYSRDYYPKLKALILILIVITTTITVLINRYISPLFITPIEEAVTSSNVQLKEQYNMLSKDYLVLVEALAATKKRDAAVYYRLFGSELIDNSNIDAQIAEHNNDTLDRLQLNDLMDILIAKSKYIEDKSTQVALSLKDCVKRSKSAALNNIPTIQPTYNRNLEYSIIPVGMRIEPFVKSFIFHTGIDYPLLEGTRVFATANGVISDATTSESKQGGMVEIDHKNYYRTRYSNLSRIVVKKGDTVKRGDIIGYSGNTGKSFLPHLHYEITYRNKPHDPFNFFFGELNFHELERLRIESEPNIQSLD